MVAKILTNFSIAAIGWWICGFAFAFGGPLGSFIGHDGGFFFTNLGPWSQVQGDITVFHPSFPVMALSDATIESKFFFQFVFCAVSLAIVWGTTLERIKFSVYVIYALVFSAVIYPIGAHWVFGGGFLQKGDWLGTGIAGMQDFAGSTAVHLIGATGAFAALLLLGPRKGKYGPDGKPRPIPGHSDAPVRPGRADPVAGLVRVQPGLDPQRPGRALPGDPDHHEPGRRGRRPRRRRRRRGSRPGTSTSAWPATARSRLWSRSPLRRAMSSSGPRRSSASWPE